MPRGGPRAPAGRRHPLPWFCESHEVSALHASLASPCPSPATRALATWACLLPSLVSLFSLSCCYAVSIVTMPQTRPLCQGSVPLQKAVSSAERPLSASSPADPTYRRRYPFLTSMKHASFSLLSCRAHRPHALLEPGSTLERH